MKCLLHIGTEKTGTTSLQAFLVENSAVLSDEGIHVCKSAGAGNNRAIPAAFLTIAKEDDYICSKNFSNIEQRKAWCESTLEDLTKEIDQSRAYAHTFVISSEHFHSRLQSDSEVQELAARLAPLFDQIDVVCYLRRQDKLAMSRYNQMLRAGRTPGGLLPQGMHLETGGLPSSYDYYSLLQRWTCAFGKSSVKVRIYDKRCLIDGDIIEDFLASNEIVVNRNKLEFPASFNRGLSAQAQVLLLNINKQVIDNPTEHLQQLRRHLTEFLNASAAGKSAQPSAQEAKNYYSYFVNSNRAVAREWLDREDLFDETFAEYPEHPTAPPLEACLHLLLDFIMQYPGFPGEGLS